MPKVSVIIPVYNVENYIEKCLESVINQTIDDIQIIIVNDDSTDTSKEKINKYIEKYNDKITYLEKENGGLSSSRNFGIPYATGEYIAFLDSDDYIEKEAYEKMYNLAKKENSDMVQCGFIWEYPNKQIKAIVEKCENKNELMEKGRVEAWNKLIKREIIEKQNLKFPEGLRYEDMEFFYKLIPYLNKVTYIDKDYIHYVQRNNSISNTQNLETKEIFTILENIIFYYKQNNIYEQYSKELEYNFIKVLLCSSLKRMCKIKDKKQKKEALKENWNNINTKFPNWRKNEILKKNTLKNLYIRSNNKFTYKIYCLIFKFI